jgi:nitrous oxidase accessory protein
MLAAAQPGDTVVLARGVHAGTLLVLHRIVLRGEPGAVIDGSTRARRSRSRQAAPSSRT